MFFNYIKNYYSCKLKQVKLVFIPVMGIPQLLQSYIPLISMFFLVSSFFLFLLWDI